MPGGQGAAVLIQCVGVLVVHADRAAAFATLLRQGFFRRLWSRVVRNRHHVQGRVVGHDALPGKRGHPPPPPRACAAAAGDQAIEAR